jgi:hypothetical protein
MAVCLHCLHADRVAARERRQRVIIRSTVWTLSLAVVGIVGAAGANAVVRHPEPAASARATTKRVAPAAAVASGDSATPAIQLQGAPAAAAPAPDASGPDSAVQSPAVTTPNASPAPVVDSAPPPSPVIGPILPQGRTDFADSVFAVRRGDTVVVSFDTGPGRTRRADKFESIVRQTLRDVYGPIADTLLAAVPSGRLTTATELVATLPRKGLHLQGPHGPRIALWPRTRPGRNGPLVVAYRTVIER